MKNAQIDFHMDRKRALVMVLSFALTFLLINLVAAITVDSDCTQLYSLLKSDYVYSAITAGSVLQDDYYQFSAGIGYTIAADANTGINAAVLMQSNESQYTESVYWNADILSTYGVAVSRGIARANGLDIGDKLYSKHIVDGTVHEYTVEQILPDITGIRNFAGNSYSNGVIIMGFDKKYIEYIDHESIVFTKDSINEWPSKFSEVPVGIVYRTDEIAAVIKGLVPYLLLFALLSVLNVIGLVFLFTKEVKFNLRRLIMLGFRKRDLDRSYYRLMFGVGISLIMIAFLVPAAVSFLFGACPIETVFLMIAAFLEFAALFLSAYLFKNRLWR